MPHEPTDKPASDLSATLHATLKKYWGHTEFRPMQLEAIESVCRGTDTLALMPTGGGKSILYQLPAMLREGLCVVVTPLISLMKDQVDRLQGLGIKAVALHSGMSARQMDIMLDNCVYGDVKFLYVAPERLGSETFRLRLSRMNVNLLAVDEAHCISQWGYDFRPSYLRIAGIRRIVPATPLLALTASATGRVAGDIMARLEFREGVILRSSFARPNLSFSVRGAEDKEGMLLRIIGSVPGSGIIYTRTREACETLSRTLRERGISADFYHAGLTHVMRSMRQEAWQSGECRIIVATNAFGMGIDKADVRFVVHYDIPDSLEEYYQEAGRAGRDGERAYAVMLTSGDDPPRARKRFDTAFPPLERIRSCYESLFNYLQIGIGEGKFSSFAFNIFDFAQRCRIFAPAATNALRVLQQNGYLILTDEADNHPRILFTVGREELYRLRIEREEFDHILRTVLRLYPGLFNDFVPIDIPEIAQASGYTRERVDELLKGLRHQRVLRYIPGSISPLLVLTEERLPAGDLYISPESYALRKEMAAERLESVFRYAANGLTCRSSFIRRYFGEMESEPCGICDLCIARRKEAVAPLRELVLASIPGEGIESGELLKRLGCDPDALFAQIESLIESGAAAVSPAGLLTRRRT